MKIQGSGQDYLSPSEEGFLCVAHWSNAVYQGRDHLQLKDGCDQVILNRDDAAGFRLDTTYTHKQHKGIQLIDQPDLTTRTDFVNNYSGLLQTSSHHFPEIGTTPKVCVGIVKPRFVYEKCPTQHMAGVQMLESRDELSFALSVLMETQRVFGVCELMELGKRGQVIKRWLSCGLRNI